MPRGPSSMLPLSPQLKDAFDKFEQDSEAANLPKGKYIKPLLPLLSGTNLDKLVLRTITRVEHKFCEDLYLP